MKINANVPSSPHSSGLPTGQRMHKPMVIHRSELQRAGDSFAAADKPQADQQVRLGQAAYRTGDAASGQATGKRVHHPISTHADYD